VGDTGATRDRKRGPIDSMLRAAYYPPERAAELRSRGISPLFDDPDDIYRTHIQLGELNALTACGHKVSTPLGATGWPHSPPRAGHGV
jgi:hypothetical protein